MLAEIGPWAAAGFTTAWAIWSFFEMRSGRARARQAQRQFIEEYEQGLRDIPGLQYSPELETQYSETKKKLARRGLRSWWP